MNNYYKRNYGITLKEYEELIQEQNNVCAICGQVCSTGKKLAIDHDHTTGKVRGLLCKNCNVALGQFKDSVDVLQKAIKYLEKSYVDNEGD